MTIRTPFTVSVDQNRYLPDGGTDLHAIISVTGTGDPFEPAEDVRLRVAVPRGVVLRSLKQVLPAEEDLSARAVEDAPRSFDHSTGRWGRRETREYHLRLRVPVQDVGQRMRAARLTVLLGGEALGAADVFAEWTDDRTRCTRIDARVAHYTGQSELAARIQAGLAAQQAGDAGTAAAELESAVQLARAQGNVPLATMLSRVIEGDETTCTFRLRRGAAPAPPPVPASSPARSGPCPECALPGEGRFCEGCGHDFATGVPGPRPAAPEDFRSRWYVVISTDPEYHRRILAESGPDAGRLPAPQGRPGLSSPLTGGRVLLGRRSTLRGTVPDIDLAVPTRDPAVSRTHAVLISRDGRWCLVDPGSANGTRLNAGSAPVAVGAEIPLHEGDRIHVGAWTTLELRRESLS
ncbi:FHA domain-containing protein [Actinocorallia populi]|uniref:FHA domain-containing protein n=1 Tax=Actinocorallia populi TaxID=2079200 RepID=UPI001E4DBBA7|nr:FHA domain-containing protein [Actinocorallia populi]